MILHVLDRVRSARRADYVLVATDDERIGSVVAGAGGNVCMTSPDHPSGTDRIWEAAREIDCDIIVNVQGDEPLLEPQIIDTTVEVLEEDPAADVGTVAVPMKSGSLGDPNVVKVVWNRLGHALYFSRAPIPWDRDGQGRESPAGKWEESGLFGWYQHLGIYAYRREALARFVAAEQSPLERTEKLEQLRALDLGMKIAVRIVESRSFGVDTPDDLGRMERWLQSSFS